MAGRKIVAEDICKELLREANKYIPGGVNSPVRSFKTVGGCPVFVERAKGSKIRSIDKREFTDYCLSWGALILGHAHPDVTEALKHAVEDGTSFGTATKSEIELAKLITEAVPSIEKVRLTNSGTEAVMSAVRLARAYTKRDKIIKFEGSYHGHADYLLARAGSGVSTFGIPDSLGVPEDFVRHTIVVSYNDFDKTEAVVKSQHQDIAAIIVEPVAGNMGVVLPKNGFLKKLRELCDEYGIVLIFDEVITGFRVSYTGVQGRFGIRPDLTCFGKIIGGGMPIGAFGGKKDIMDMLAPLGGVYQAGTLSGNPISVTAGIITLKLLKRMLPYEWLESKTQTLCSGIKEAADEIEIKARVNSIGSMFSVFFTDREVSDYETAKGQDIELFKRFYHGLLREKVYFAPSPFESNFVSLVHTDDDISETINGIKKVFAKIT